MSPERATYALKNMVGRGARISWEIPHARERAIERDVTTFEAERIIRSGNVVRVDTEVSGQERWRVSGSDADGRPVDVVVKPIREAVLRVVTVIRTDE